MAHWCQDETTALMAALPFLGYICMRCRQLCRACLSLVLRRRPTSACGHHGHGYDGGAS